MKKSAAVKERNAKALVTARTHGPGRNDVRGMDVTSATPDGWCRVVEIQQQRLLTPIIPATHRSYRALLLTVIRGATRHESVTSAAFEVHSRISRRQCTGTLAPPAAGAQGGYGQQCSAIPAQDIGRFAAASNSVFDGVCRPPITPSYLLVESRFAARPSSRWPSSRHRPGLRSSAIYRRSRRCSRAATGRLRARRSMPSVRCSARLGASSGTGGCRPTACSTAPVRAADIRSCWTRLSPAVRSSVTGATGAFRPLQARLNRVSFEVAPGEI